MDEFMGIIKLFAGNFAPRDWAFCNGQLLSISQNTALFSLLGTTYGGDGRTTFALPDLRGRAAVGFGQGPGLSNYTQGEVTGTESVTLTTNQMPAHTHTAQSTVHASGRADSDNPANAVPALSGSQIYASAPDGSTTMNAGMVTTQVGPAGGNQPVSIVQPVLVLNYIICVEGLFPSRS